MTNSSLTRTKEVARFQDRYGDERVVHRNAGGTLRVRRLKMPPTDQLGLALAPVVGSRIRERRKALGFSMEELGIRAGLNNVNMKQWVWNIETCKVGKGFVKLGTLYALAYALGCEARDLMPDVAEVIRLSGVPIRRDGPLMAVPNIESGLVAEDAS